MSEDARIRLLRARYKAAERQLRAWAMGAPYHCDILQMCTPDRSCCDPGNFVENEDARWAKYREITDSLSSSVTKEAAKVEARQQAEINREFAEYERDHNAAVRARQQQVSPPDEEAPAPPSQRPDEDIDEDIYERMIPKWVYTKRQCVICKRTFLSQHLGNRVCGSCRGVIDDGDELRFEGCSTDPSTGLVASLIRGDDAWEERVCLSSGFWQAQQRYVMNSYWKRLRGTLMAAIRRMGDEHGPTAPGAR